MTTESRPADDETVIDRIAAILGTAERWTNGLLEDIADQVGLVRPHPGNTKHLEYPSKFLAATGREIEPCWNRNLGEE
jgi:hypothetical protein